MNTTQLSVDLYTKEATVDGIVFHSSFGLGYASSCVCILCAVHQVSLRILRVETRLEERKFK